MLRRSIYRIGVLQIRLFSLSFSQSQVSLFFASCFPSFQFTFLIPFFEVSLILTLWSVWLLRNWRKMKEGKGDRYFVNPRPQNFEVINSRFTLVFNSTTELQMSLVCLLSGNYEFAVKFIFFCNDPLCGAQGLNEPVLFLLFVWHHISFKIWCLKRVLAVEMKMIFSEIFSFLSNPQQALIQPNKFKNKKQKKRDSSTNECNQVQGNERMRFANSFPLEL